VLAGVEQRLDDQYLGGPQPEPVEVAAHRLLDELGRGLVQRLAAGLGQGRTGQRDAYQRSPPWQQPGQTGGGGDVLLREFEPATPGMHVADQRMGLLQTEVLVDVAGQRHRQLTVHDRLIPVAAAVVDLAQRAQPRDERRGTLPAAGT
jgi:hypothetical protein